MQELVLCNYNYKHNGMELPPYLHFGNISVAMVHDLAQKCCRKCHSTEHLDYECYIQRCYNCNELGHLSKSCENDLICILCKNPNHVAVDCPFNWARPKLNFKVLEDKKDGDLLEDDEEKEEINLDSEVEESSSSDQSLEQENDSTHSWAEEMELSDSLKVDERS